VENPGIGAIQVSSNSHFDAFDQKRVGIKQGIENVLRRFCMTELPIAPVDRIIRKAGAERVSQEAAQALASVMENYIIDLTEKAVILAQHAGRKTVRVEDVSLAT